MKYISILTVFVVLFLLAFYLKFLSKVSWIQRNGEYEKLFVIKPVPSDVKKEDIRLLFSRFDQSDKFSPKEIKLIEMCGQKAFDALSAIQMTYSDADKNEALNYDVQSGLQTFMAVEYDGKWGRSKFHEIKNSNYVRFFPDMNGSSYRLIDRRKFPPWLNLLVSNEVKL